MSQQHQAEVSSGARFRFGRNWAIFLNSFTEERLVAAEKSLRDMLCLETLDGLTFLDIGSGSGLFSLAARRLGAKVVSFDFDPDSVACTKTLRQAHFPEDANWRVEEGSVLDEGYMSALGSYDVVYSWGVLHHTGDMDRALLVAGKAVKPGGKLFIAIYNDQGVISRYWTIVKQTYNRNAVGRVVMVLLHAPYLFGLRVFVRFLTGKGRLERGMAIWRDVIDWLGGYPYEVARPERIFRLFRDRGFELRELVTCGGRMGCNEYVFRLTMKPKKN